MRAVVNAEHPWNIVRACAGAEFIKGEARPVPLGLEGEARHYEAAGLLVIIEEPQAALDPGELTVSELQEALECAAFENLEVVLAAETAGKGRRSAMRAIQDAIAAED